MRKKKIPQRGSPQGRITNLDFDDLIVAALAHMHSLHQLM